MTVNQIYVGFTAQDGSQMGIDGRLTPRMSLKSFIAPRMGAKSPRMGVKSPKMGLKYQATY